MRRFRQFVVIALLVTFVQGVVGCSSAAPRASHTRPPNSAATSVRSRPTPSTALAATPAAALPANTLNASRPTPYILASKPSGYDGPHVERAFDYARTVYYRPGFTADATSDPLRISIESVLSDATVESFLGSYVSLGTTLVKGAKATYFIVSAQRRDSHARHGVTWSPQPGRRVTIYAYADESYLVRLAALAAPAGNN